MVRSVVNKGYGKAGLPFTVAPGGTGGLDNLVKQEVIPVLKSGLEELGIDFRGNPDMNVRVRCTCIGEAGTELIIE